MTFVEGCDDGFYPDCPGFERSSTNFIGAPTSVIPRSNECCYDCAGDTNCCGFNANATHCLLYNGCPVDSGNRRKLEEATNDGFWGFMKVTKFDDEPLSLPDACTTTPSPACYSTESRASLAAGNGYGGAGVELCYLDDTCSDPEVGGLGCNAGGNYSCRFCGFKHYQDCPQPDDPSPSGHPEPLQPGSGCGNLPAAATCTTNPHELCYEDPECSNPEVDHLGCNAGGHHNCRFCDFKHYGRCPIQTTSWSLLAALSNSYTDGYGEHQRVSETSDSPHSALAGPISQSLVFVALAALGAAVMVGIVNNVRRAQAQAGGRLESDDSAPPPSKSWFPLRA